MSKRLMDTKLQLSQVHGMSIIQLNFMKILILWYIFISSEIWTCDNAVPDYNLRN